MIPKIFLFTAMIFMTLVGSTPSSFADSETLNVDRLVEGLFRITLRFRPQR